MSVVIVEAATTDDPRNVEMYGSTIRLKAGHSAIAQTARAIKVSITCIKVSKSHDQVFLYI
jgi:hypothetical protein